MMQYVCDSTTQINITQIIEELHQVKCLLDKYVRTGALFIEDERAVVDFMIRYHETNDMVSYAINGIRNESDKTLAEFTGLLQKAESFLAFYNVNCTSLNSIDFKADSKKYLKTFDEEYRQAAAEATTIWKRIQELSNSLDYMWDTDEHYPSYRSECDEKESLYYNVLQPRVDRLFAEYKKQETYIAPIYYFELEMLVIVVMKMKDISTSVIEDINAIRKEDKA